MQSCRGLEEWNGALCMVVYCWCTLYLKSYFTIADDNHLCTVFDLPNVAHLKVKFECPAFIISCTVTHIPRAWPSLFAGTPDQDVCNGWRVLGHPIGRGRRGGQDRGNEVLRSGGILWWVEYQIYNNLNLLFSSITPQACEHKQSQVSVAWREQSKVSSQK